MGGRLHLVHPPAVENANVGCHRREIGRALYPHAHLINQQINCCFIHQKIHLLCSEATRHFFPFFLNT